MSEPGPGSDAAPLPKRRAAAAHPHQPAVSSGRQTYNVVSDTIGGVNIRRRDNLFQAAFIGACLLIAVPLGGLLFGLGGALVGALDAQIVGVIVSGAIIGVYRAMQHIRGRHD